MEKNLGIYMHIPFCAGRCAYCDFYSTSGQEDCMPDYDTALRRHIREYAPQLDGYVIDSVYFGGGTPSYYGAARLISALETLKKHGHVRLDAEISFEANPDSVNKPDLVKLRRAGFNRISIGAQSMSDDRLHDIGRRHTTEQTLQAVSVARAAGFDNLSLDLMYGLPSQSRADWEDTVTRAAALKPEHLSCYGLKLEEGTPLYIFKDSPFLPDGDEQADMYLYMVETLSRFGYKQYEISNFARRGYESRHNLKYWLGDEYLGFGAAAHSFIGGTRYSVISDLTEYTRRMGTGESVIATVEEISEYEALGEYLMLRLRTTRGISEEEYTGIYHSSMELVLNLLRDYEKQGWAQLREGRWRFTPTGFLLSNTLIGNLLEAQTRQHTLSVRPWQTPPDIDQQTSLFSDNRWRMKDIAPV